MRETLLKIWVAVTALLMALPVAMAAEPGAGEVNEVTTKGPWTYSPTDQTVSVTGGEITVANLTTEQSTYHWAGIYGNVTGKLILGSGSDKMYEWTGKGVYVYLNKNSSVVWTSLTNATCSDVEGAYGFLTGASDDCAHTFKTTRNFNSHIISLGSGNNNILAALTYSAGGVTEWYTLALKDTSENDIVFAGEVVEDGTTYDGEEADYQVIVPENEESGSTGTTDYYVWIELY